jgi:hypothetical protein
MLLMELVLEQKCKYAATSNQTKDEILIMKSLSLLLSKYRNKI